MNIGATIKKIRRGRDITQEQLAEYLNVSVSAVSQWESEKTTPDISLIPALCNILGITSDELLGIDLEKKKEKIDAISTESYSYAKNGYSEKSRQILLDGLKQFPDSYRLMSDLMYTTSSMRSDYKYSKEERDGFLEEVIRLGERILEGCTEDFLRHGAIQMLCFAYNDKSDTDRAVKLAQSMPISCFSKEHLLSGIYRGTKGRESTLNLIFYDSIQTLVKRIAINYKMDSGEMFYTQEQLAVLRDKQIELFNVLFENNDFGFYYDELCDTYKEQAAYYAKESNAEKTLYNLAKASECAVSFVGFINEGKYKHTSLLFKGLVENAEGIYMDHCDNNASQLLSTMKNTEYDFIREKPEFKEIETQLTGCAGQWKVDK